jgi:NTP pyrophosphatase (non-canonical NTP hydrolase)
MRIAEYQKEARKTSIRLGHDRITPLTPNQEYAAMGLANEAGEFLGVVKKAKRGDYGDCPCLSETFLRKLRGELGDVAWYLAECCSVFGFELGGVMADNLRKLQDRQERGVIQGDGDDR